MKHTGSLRLWQQRLAKVSLVLVLFLLFEAYRDRFIGTKMAIAQDKTNNTSNDASTTNQDVYAEKLNAIIKNLQFLQKQGQLTNVQVPGKQRGPEFALEAGKLHPMLHPSYTPAPCELGMQPATDWANPVTPRFELNPTRFVYPILKNEPIDQLIGLRQAILLAIRLNRTLAMPYFHNHNYGGASQYNPALPSPLKVNVEILRRFISVISVDELQKKCKGKFDVVLLTGHKDLMPGTASLLKAQSEVQMRMLNTLNTSVVPDFKVMFNIPVFPKNLQPGEKISIIPRDLATVYPRETAKFTCAVHPFPLTFFDLNLFLRKAMKLPSHKINIFKMKDEVLYSAIWQYTQPPIFVPLLMQEIVEDVMHAQEIDGVYNYMCLNYHKHSPDNGEDASEDIDMNTLRNILNLIIEKIAERPAPLKLSAIYISSPLSKQGQAKEYRQNLKIFEKHDEIPVFSGEDIIARWTEKYFHGEKNAPESMCSLLEDDTQDILSLIEMQICIDAAIFIRSIGSSWAANVQANRVKSGYSDLDATMKGLMEEQRLENEKKREMKEAKKKEGKKGKS